MLSGMRGDTSGSARIFSPGPDPNTARSEKECVMCPRTELVETRVYRRERDKDVLCQLTYEVTPFRDDLLRWFLVGIKELE